MVSMKALLKDATKLTIRIELPKFRNDHIIGFRNIFYFYRDTECPLKGMFDLKGLNFLVFQLT